MEDRLDIALERAIRMIEDERVKEILSAVRCLGDDIGYMDWTDFSEICKNGELDEMIRAYFN